MNRALSLLLALLLVAPTPAFASPLVQPAPKDCDCPEDVALPPTRDPLQPGMRTIVSVAPAPAASPSAREEPLLIEADHLDIEEDEAGALLARGNVVAWYQDIQVRADAIKIDRGTRLGEALGSVRLDRAPYHLKSERMSFDLGKRTIKADQWQATIDRQGWFGGNALHLADEIAWSEDVRVSPCSHEDPGYWLSADRMDWYPHQASWNLRGSWVRVIVGGLTVLMLPYFAASVGEEAEKRKIRFPDRRIDATVGFDGTQGVYIDSQTPYQLGPGLSGAIPVRLMQNRGIAAGIIQDMPVLGAKGHFDANYTQYYPWLFNDQGQLTNPDDAGRQGLHANYSLTKSWGNGVQSIMNMGYRVDVGKRNDLAYQVDPGGYPIHRLPEITTTWPSISLGSISLSPSVRGGYLIEERSNQSSGVLQANLGLGLPGWRPNSFWETSFYGGASACYYTVNRTQSILFLGMANTQHWQPWFSTSFNLETQPVHKTGGNSPFAYDNATAVDRLFVSSNLKLQGPWTLGVSAFWSREHEKPLAFGSLTQGDLALGLRYAVNCLSLGVTFRPIPQQYTFDYQVVTF